jgi:phosphate transport system substrate-binding protein
MTYGEVQNRAGTFVEPSILAFQAAATSAEWSEAQDFGVVMTDAPGADAYPITAATFVLMYKHPKDEARSRDALAFFKWALERGQGLATSLDYVPLSDELVNQIETYWQVQIH